MDASVTVTCRVVHRDKAAVVEQDKEEAAVAELELIGTVVAVPDAGWGCGHVTGVSIHHQYHHVYLDVMI